MKVLVTIKRGVDPYVRIRIKPDLSGVELANVKMSTNPFDEIALEEAIRLKEQGIVKEIIAVAIGDTACQENLRSALALGADQAELVQITQTLEPLHVAEILKMLVQKYQPQLVLMGKQSIDGDHNQTGQMLAAKLGWPQATFASRIEIRSDQNGDDPRDAGFEVWVAREVDGGLEIIAVQLPAVVTADLRLNHPRYPSLPSIMKAQRLPLTITSLDSFNINFAPHIKVLKVEPPPARKAGIKVQDVKGLVEKLRFEAKVI